MRTKIIGFKSNVCASYSLVILFKCTAYSFTLFLKNRLKPRKIRMFNQFDTLRSLLSSLSYVVSYIIDKSIVLQYRFYKLTETNIIYTSLFTINGSKNYKYHLFLRDLSESWRTPLVAEWLECAATYSAQTVHTPLDRLHVGQKNMELW